MNHPSSWTWALALVWAAGCATAPGGPPPAVAHEEEIASVVRRIDEARAQHGKPPTLPLHRIMLDLARLSAAVERGEQDPGQSLRPLLDKAAQSLGGGWAYAWIDFSEDLAALRVPDNLTEANTLRVAVGIARCQPRGAPRPGYCVLVAAVQRMGSGMAAAGGAPGTGGPPRG
jgi:hypothetical protein